LEGKSGGKIPVGTLACRWKDNIKMNLENRAGGCGRD
jgi:hypothetical protein